MAIKRNITDISTLKRGANTLTAVYRGSTLIWPTTPPVDIDHFNTTMVTRILTPQETKFASTMTLYTY